MPAAAVSPPVFATPAVAAPMPAPSPPFPSGREALELIWADPAAAARVRRAFADVLADVAPPSAGDAEETKVERWEAAVVRVLVAGRRCDALALEDAMADAVGTDARFRPPTVLVAGELRFVFEDGEGQPERVLLGRRAYQRRALFGGDRIRALLTLPGAEAACPVYLPEALARALPMFPAFEARLLAEAHPAQDAGEAHPVALKALALGRWLSAGRRRR
jgi:hypothetical protein